jgi:thiamine biosynthesis lipoprotein
MTTATFPAMGGAIEVQLPAPAAGQLTAIERLFAEHERVMSRFLPDSELCALNANAGAAFAASPLLFDVGSEACGWACVTGGVFDPTVIDVLEATGYDRPFERIDGGVAVAERPRTRRLWREIAFDFERDVITLPRDVRIDLGGIGKGYTVDRAIESLASQTTAKVYPSGDR